MTTQTIPENDPFLALVLEFALEDAKGVDAKLRLLKAFDFGSALWVDSAQADEHRWFAGPHAIQRCQEYHAGLRAEGFLAAIFVLCEERGFYRWY